MMEKKSIIIGSMLFFSSLVYSQVGINTANNTPQTQGILSVFATATYVN